MGFKNILIAEDMSSTNSGVKKLLSDNYPLVHTTHYCDEALLKAKSELQKNTPFDLLVTDLSFIKDHRPAKLTNGQELIAAIKELQPNIKVIVFSMEGSIGKVKQLLENFAINAFVQKGANDLKELKKAVTSVTNNTTYLSPAIEQLLKNQDAIETIEDVDIFILKLLSQGIGQDDIPSLLKQNSHPNYKLRSVQIRIKKLKDFLEANNAAHLISIAKDQGLI